MVYTIPVWIITDPITIIMLGAVSGILLVKVAYKILELIPGM